MPAFKLDDRFQVPDEMHGAKLQWLGKQGTVVRVMPGGQAQGTVGLGQSTQMDWQPFYEVLFDGETESELLDEHMMRPVEPS